MSISNIEWINDISVSFYGSFILALERKV